MKSPRWARVTVVAAWMVSACGPEPVPTPAPTPKPPPTESQGDWEDPGRYAACQVYSVKGVACGEPEVFDLASCDTGSLAGLARDAAYTVVYRTERAPPTISPDAFRLSPSGHSYRGVTPAQARLDDRDFFLSSTSTNDAGVSTRYSLRGCRAEGDRLYGCYAGCRNGQFINYGTFLAQRVSRRPGEAEASGLTLVSESPVSHGLAADVYVTQGHAYVVSLPLGGTPGGLSVFDVRDPAAPVLKTEISLPKDNYWNGVWAQGNALYVASANTGVITFDISNPAAPRLLRSLPSGVGAIDVHTVFVEGERLYAMSVGPLPKALIFDIRQPTEPAPLGEYVEPGAGVDWTVGFPHDALAFEGRLYINHWRAGYLVVDVSDPREPKKLGAFTYPYATSHANAVGRFGDRLIAFEGGESWGAHLRVLDVTDPTNPRRIGEYKLSEHVSIHNMVLVGQRLYIAHYQHGVRVLDVSVPESPREVAYFNTVKGTEPHRGEGFYDGAIGIRVPGDGHVYVIDTSRGMLIFPEP
ncbi:LVIVD repeat-containing protein [Melittangium boletus]|uniref:LVIVD repeat-containing protein n=1 Tax=Melittangium boletus TaxID=83453 RepID=UPI003DA429CD